MAIISESEVQKIVVEVINSINALEADVAVNIVDLWIMCRDNFNEEHFSIFQAVARGLAEAHIIYSEETFGQYS